MLHAGLPRLIGPKKSQRGPRRQHNYNRDLLSGWSRHSVCTFRFPISVGTFFAKSLRTSNFFDWSVLCFPCGLLTGVNDDQAGVLPLQVTAKSMSWICSFWKMLVVAGVSGNASIQVPLTPALRIGSQASALPLRVLKT
jgi:hypothetical protein